MLWRNLCLVRAVTAAGLLSFATVGTAFAAEPADPVPTPAAQAETVRILDGQKSGVLALEARGKGRDHVRITVRNTSAKRLNVVLPAGLVASSTVAQGGPGLQSMGLGAVDNRPGGFGRFARAGEGVGFRSVPASGERTGGSLIVPAGESLSVDLPAVCLNFGLPSPTTRDVLRVVDVDDYTSDVRVRKALRSVVELGTSQGTAQAIMWKVCNNVPFEAMIAKGEKVMNRHEVALASRFVDALDASGSSDLVDPAYISEARMFVTVVGEGTLAKDAHRISGELEGLRVLGMPVRVASAKEAPTAQGPALHLVVSLNETSAGKTEGRVSIKAGRGLSRSEWSNLGQVAFEEKADAAKIDGPALARSVERAVSRTFVKARIVRKGQNASDVRIENRLPFSIAGVTLKAGDSMGAPLVSIDGLGIGPVRSGMVSIESPVAQIERVEFNGL